MLVCVDSPNPSFLGLPVAHHHTISTPQIWDLENASMTGMS